MSAPQRFAGQIAGVGSRSGTRVVVGRWLGSPLGAFADAMVERADGHRILIAPRQDVADFVAQTYVFDEVRVEAFRVDANDTRWIIESDSLAMELAVGPRLPLGWLLQTIPYAVATRPAFTHLTDPIARVMLRGVRTRGTAREGRREFYAATDLRAVTALRGCLDGHDLGDLAPVDPACRFGFSSAPRRPSVTSLTTTVTIR